MESVDIRKRIHEFIDIADERILRIFNSIIDAEEQEDNYPAVPDWYYEKLEVEREAFKRNSFIYLGRSEAKTDE
jgi:hypothetical protein